MRVIITIMVIATVEAVLALSIETDFEGASVKVIETNNEAQSIRFMPGGDPAHGWPCWWYFRVTGLDAARPLTLVLQGSDAVTAPTVRPLNASWAMPVQATYSLDGKTWQHTGAGRRDGTRMIYGINAHVTSVLIAWGPPYTPARAAAFVRDAVSKNSWALENELCKSREGRSVPMLRVCEGDRVEARRFAVWVQARQHAWESGSSWVAEGFADWLMGDDAEAHWLRQNAEIFIVPVMDADNAATGNGGKDALPQDHNRDWSDKPNWNEVAAAQRMISELVKEGRMDVFLDLHNPAPDDLKAFFFESPSELGGDEARSNRAQFMSVARKHIAPAMPMLDKSKQTGSGYHPLWKQISGNWVTAHGNARTMALCLETPWNTERSTTEGYQAVGRALAKAVQEYLVEKTAR